MDAGNSDCSNQFRHRQNPNATGSRTASRTTPERVGPPSMIMTVAEATAEAGDPVRGTVEFYRLPRVTEHPVAPELAGV
jgi:hypothetical protein